MTAVEEGATNYIVVVGAIKHSPAAQISPVQIARQEAPVTGPLLKSECTFGGNAFIKRFNSTVIANHPPVGNVLMEQCYSIILSGGKILASNQRT